MSEQTPHPSILWPFRDEPAQQDPLSIDGFPAPRFRVRQGPVEAWERGAGAVPPAPTFLEGAYP